MFQTNNLSSYLSKLEKEGQIKPKAIVEENKNQCRNKSNRKEHTEKNQ